MQTAMIGVIIPFLGTTLGAALVFFLKDKLHPLVEKSFLGFAAGVMIAASVWSLILPAMELTSHSLKWFPCRNRIFARYLFLACAGSVRSAYSLKSRRTGRHSYAAEKNNHANPGSYHA